MKNRKAFNFYRSYYEVAMELSLEDRALFLTALMEKQFEDIEPSLEGISKLAYLSQKHSINSQVEGFKNKKGNDPSEPPSVGPSEPPSVPPSVGPSEPPSVPPSVGPSEPPSVQEQEQEKGKEKEQDLEKDLVQKYLKNKNRSNTGEIDIFDLDFTSTEANELADKFLKARYNV